MSKFENNNGQNSNPLYYESNYGVDEKGQDIEMGQMVMGVTGTTGGRGSNPQTPSGDSRAPERKVEPRRNPKNPEQRRPVRANGKGVPQKAPQNVRPRTEMKTARTVLPAKPAKAIPIRQIAILSERVQNPVFFISRPIDSPFARAYDVTNAPIIDRKAAKIPT